MDAYPFDLTEHNWPLLVLSGLGEQNGGDDGPQAPRQESGSRVVLKSEECESMRAQSVLRQFSAFDGSQSPRNATSVANAAGNSRFKIETIGRTFTLPPRKAAPLPQSPGEGGAISSTALHSPLSPLSPGSPIFPDGLFTPLWMRKHQHKIPAMLLVFFDISPDDDASLFERIQTDINAIRSALTRSGHRTKLAVVLMSDRSILDAPGMEDRLSAVRRSTSLDPKTGLFFLPPMSSDAELADFVQNLLSILHPLCIEYYRELTKHARRKKTRGGPAAIVTSPGGSTAKGLPTSGWNARYDVKQGVFAEFRQEMDAAERHYSAAIEELFSSDGALETTPNWSPRWEEARLLSDSIAIRVIRCQLWNGVTTGAVLSWLNYQARMKSLVERKGQGSGTYSWAAWEARWAEIMAVLVNEARVPGLVGQPGEASGLEPEQQNFFAPPERVMERLPPFHFLHHPGYWHQLAIRAHQKRRQRALMLSDEARTAPAQLPASEVAKKSGEHDLFLVPHPHEEYPMPGEQGFDYLAELDRLSKLAIDEFSGRKQPRTSAQVQLNLATALISEDRQAEALAVLKPVWRESVWRADEWHGPFSRLLSLLLPCAAHENDAEVLVAATWDLLGTRTSLDESDINFSHCLDNIKTEEQKLVIRAEDKQLHSPVRVSFAFSSPQGFVSEPLECQLTVESCATTGSAPIVLSDIEINIGTNQILKINHEEGSTVVKASPVVDLSHASVDAGDVKEIEAPLEFSPGQSRTFQLLVNFREADDVVVRSIRLAVRTTRFDLEHTFTHEHIRPARTLCYEQDDAVGERFLRHLATTAVTVLPKPPKVEIQLLGTRAQYYTDETLQFAVTLVNGEAETIEGVAHAVVNSPSGDEVDIEWLNTERETMPKLVLSDVAPGDSTSATILFHAPSVPASLTLGLEVSYTLSSDPSVPLVKTMRVEMEFVLGFEAKFDVGPWLSSDPWPNYFSMTAATDQDQFPEGITHKWLLRSKIRSLIPERLVIKESELALDEEPHDTKCSLQKYHHTELQTLEPHTTVKTEYEFTTQKLSFDDRRATSADLSLKVIWARDEASEPCTTILSIPRLTLPSSEPRVLCSLGAAPSEDEMVIQYHLENPSAHFLTFAVTLEANDTFGFSGSKFRTLSLAPLSRYMLEYRVVVYGDEDHRSNRASTKSGRWIWPVLQVLDSYYQKNLKIHPGGPGVKVDETTSAIGVLVEE